MNDKDYKTTRLQDYKLRLLTFVFSLFYKFLFYRKTFRKI